jgi:CarD family transcriptional regulator
MFIVEEKVVYPGHGVAKINRILTKLVGTDKASFYELVFLNKDMTILVPTDNAESVGVRPLSSHQCIKDVLAMLTTPAQRISQAEFTASNWNKRNKEYQIKLKTGTLRELSEIYRELHFIAGYKELSFGEKHLLQQIESLLVEEISLVEQLGQEKTIEHLRSLCAAHKTLEHALF